MSVQYSVAVNNARLDAWEATIGAAPLLRLYTGAQPANCAAAASGTKLAELTLPSNWMADASAGAKALAGSWDGVGLAAGTAAHYRIYNAAGSVCHEQGSVAIGSGDLPLDNTVIAVGQAISITQFTKNASNV